LGIEEDENIGALKKAINLDETITDYQIKRAKITQNE